MRSIPASRWRSELTGRITGTAGPLAVTIEAPDHNVAGAFGYALALYGVAWPFPGEMRTTELLVQLSDAPVTAAEGRYLDAAWLRVDRLPHGLRATAANGGSVVGHFSEGAERWQATLPSAGTSVTRQQEADEILALLLTTGWRRAGWVPLHAAGVERGGRGALICATTQGGKTSLALGLAARGWHCLSDDKLLIAERDERVVAVALQHVLHVDPASRRWFPALDRGDWDAFPAGPGPKRRVSLESIWPGGSATVATAGDVIVLEQPDEERASSGVTVHPLTQDALLMALLRQTALPNDRAIAGHIMGTLATLARSTRGWAVSVGHDAYADPRALDGLAAAIA